MIKRFALATSILALVAPLALAQTSTWISDPAHSEVDFSVKHLSLANVHGRFGHVSATLTYNEADITKSSVTATIDIGGVETGESPRNNHLKSDSFFDVAKFPSATFTSTSVAKDGDMLKVTGNLTLHGVTKQVVLSVEGPATPVMGMMDKKLHTGFTATTTIHRLDFAIGSTFPDAIVSDKVMLTIELDLAKQ